MAKLSAVARHSLAAVAFVASALTAAPAAFATATYDSLAELTLTLTGVTDTDRNSVTQGWSIDAAGYLYNTGATHSGSAGVDFDFVLAPATDLWIGDSVYQSSGSYGWATDGNGQSSAQTDLAITLENLSGQSLLFNFSYTAMIEAMVTGTPLDGDDGYAIAGIEIGDSLGFVDLLFNAHADLLFSPLTDADTLNGEFSIRLDDGGGDSIYGMIDSRGFASASDGPGYQDNTVREPTTIVLLMFGLAAIGILRQRTA